MQELPDGSGCFTASFPLPKDHWLYGQEFHVPHPCITETYWRTTVAEHIKHALWVCTQRGQDMDFDPDAVVITACNNIFGPSPTPAIAL